VVYGNAPSDAAVAGMGDSVVVVFEDPNSTTPRIGIALSRSAGHVFEERGQVTPDDVRAAAPWVALDHEKITVWWKTPDQSGSQYGDQVGYRTGAWR
jgi:class 3 adenylate cyclase